MTASIEIYCAGACKGNTGSPGGWGVWAPTLGPGVKLYGGEAESTNNRMELTAMIKALELVIAAGLEPAKCIIFSDSQYVVNGTTSWLSGWKRKGWQTSSGPVKNKELWERIDALYSKIKPKIQWVKGHAGNPGNEMSDLLSNKGVLDTKGLGIDTVSAQIQAQPLQQSLLDSPPSGAQPGTAPAGSTSAAVFGPEIGLLVVDLQRGFGPSAELVDKINNELCSQYQTVAATLFTNPPTGLFRSELKYHLMTQGEPETKSLLKCDSALTLHKTGYGLNAELIAILKKTGVTTWHLCGIESDACVLACAFSLWDNGLAPVMLSSFCQAGTDKAHKEAAAVFKRQFGKHNLR